jgi:hypothetical protein
MILLAWPPVPYTPFVGRIAINFRTGCIRPTNGVYGTGGQANNIITGVYLQNGLDQTLFVQEVRDRDVFSVYETLQDRTSPGRTTSDKFPHRLYPPHKRRVWHRRPSQQYHYGCLSPERRVNAWPPVFGSFEPGSLCWIKRCSYKRCAIETFSVTVTDPNPAIAFEDLYTLLTTLSRTPLAFPEVQPLVRKYTAQ